VGLDTAANGTDRAVTDESKIVSKEWRHVRGNPITPRAQDDIYINCAFRLLCLFIIIY
jgi:hypothetical protein